MGILEKSTGWAIEMFLKQSPVRTFEEWLALLNALEFPYCRLCSNNQAIPHFFGVNPNII
jgi:hypothetical protein